MKISQTVSELWSDTNDGSADRQTDGQSKPEVKHNTLATCLAGHKNENQIMTYATSMDSYQLRIRTV